jgi:hypothetical protein
MYPVAAWPRSIATNPLSGKQRYSLLRRQSGHPPRINISEFVCLSDWAMSKNTCVSGCGAIFPSIGPPPPPHRLPLGFLPNRDG